MKVWMSTLRRGVSWHTVAPDGWRTTCGRYIGHNREHGHIVGRVEAVDEYAAHQCKHCAGSSELVDPVKGRPWTS